MPRLAHELQTELPGVKGFSERNIKSMVGFYREYPDPASIVQQPVAQLASHSFSPKKAKPSDAAPDFATIGREITGDS